MLAPLRHHPSLATATLSVALISVGLMAINEGAGLYDIGWHASPAKRVPFLGLPHPWTADHLTWAVSLAASLILVAGLLHRRGQRRVSEPLALVSAFGFRGPLGAWVMLATVCVGQFGLLFDAAYHRAYRAQLIERLHSTFSAPHTLLRFCGIALFLSLALLLYDLAFGPVFRDRPDRRLLARAGLLVSLVWVVCGSVAFIPGTLANWNTGIVVVLASVGVALGLTIGVQLWPYRFSALSILGLFVLVRAAGYGLLIKSDFTGAPPPLEPVLVGALAVDLWLLLPFNRPRGVVAVLVAGLLFGLAWSPLAVRYFMPLTVADATPPGLIILQSGAAGLFGGLIGLLVARTVKAALQPRVAAPEPRAVVAEA
jgi:hypothetical protein